MVLGGGRGKMSNMLEGSGAAHRQFKGEFSLGEVHRRSLVISIYLTANYSS